MAPRAKLETALRKGHIFSSPRFSQIDHMLLINEEIWKDRTITAEAIRELGDPPECPAVEEDSIPCITLLSETGNAVETLTRNWAACRFIHGVIHTEKVSGLMLTGKYVRQRKGAEVRRKGLR
ncbi:MAG: hypothetical protein Q7S48_01020 [bacterium]|nr:hypothetical protein [bacterium]